MGYIKMKVIKNIYNFYDKFVYVLMRFLNKSCSSSVLKNTINVIYNPLLVSNLIEPNDRASFFPLEKELIHETKILVQIHIFYVDLLDEIIENLNCIPYAYDLYISTDDAVKAKAIAEGIKGNVLAKNTIIETYANKGRDVIPFLKQIREHYRSYEYICHLHTKKSLHDEIGNTWRKLCYKALLGSSNNVRFIFQLFNSNNKLGLIFTYLFEHNLFTIDWGGEKEKCQLFFNSLGFESELPRGCIFPAGDMFWARSNAVPQLLNYKFNENDIPEELGQIKGTIMHAIERLWVYVAKENGYDFVQVKVKL